jgi:hypothetical protein
MGYYKLSTSHKINQAKWRNRETKKKLKANTKMADVNFGRDTNIQTITLMICG